jgi:hypothetical protein
MFKQGKFYAISGTDRSGKTVFLEATAHYDDHKHRLKSIARKAARYSSNLDDFDYHDDYSSPVQKSDNPFEVKTWPADANIKIIISHMRMIRQNASSADVDPNSLKITIVETSVTSYTPESPSEEETELRRYVLEKLSQEEKELLKVTHWEVYNKLADRSMLDDETEE